MIRVAAEISNTPSFSIRTSSRARFEIRRQFNINGQISKMMTNMLLLMSIMGSVISATAEFPRNATQTSYYLTDNFAGTTFFDNFHFDTYDDPTHGNYLISIYCLYLCSMLTRMLYSVNCV